MSRANWAMLFLFLLGVLAWLVGNEDRSATAMAAMIVVWALDRART